MGWDSTPLLKKDIRLSTGPICHALVAHSTRVCLLRTVLLCLSRASAESVIQSREISLVYDHLAVIIFRKCTTDEFPHKS